MKIELTDEQEELIQQVIAWYRNPDADQSYEVSG